MTSKKPGIFFITCLFLFSGVSGIIYEIVWVRMFGLVFGNTVFASSTVLSVFMTGLAAGSWLLGRYIDRRKDPLFTYVVMELGIAIFGLVVPVCINASTPLNIFVFRHFNPSFYQMSLFRVGVSFVILIVPCTLMGGTLPVISAFISKAFGGMPEKQAGRMYAVNTAGAVLGCLVSGYVLIGTTGLIGTTAIAACINFAIAASVFIYGKRAPVVQSIRDGNNPETAPMHSINPDSTPKKNVQIKTVIALYAVSGFLSLFLEVAWTRAIVWVMGMDAYAFASMLAVFLFGLAFGSFLVARSMTKKSGAVLHLAIIEFLIGLSVLFSAVMILNMYGLMSRLESVFHKTDYWGALFFFITIAAAIMAVPSLLMGMAFPLALKIMFQGAAKTGEGVGAVYAANTIGSVFGALTAGFISVPLFGVMKSIVLAGGVFLLIAAALLMTAWNYRKTAVNAASIALAAASIVLMLTYAPSLTKALEKGLGEHEKLLYFKETVTGGVEVTQSPEDGRSLKIDGIHVASDGQTDVASHKYPAHLMTLLNKRLKSACIIAFGAGGTAGSLLRYPELERLDAVEICAGVVEPAKRFFMAMNNGALEDPRLRLIIQDGKNFVKLTDKTYDIIYSGPIHPQSNQGSAALYTKDFFEDCRKRLNKGGLQCVWLPLHVPPSDFKTIVRSFQQVYPHSSMWLTSNSPNTLVHTHLIGSMEPLFIDYQFVNYQLRKGAVAADNMDYVTLSGAFDLVSQCVMGEDKLREFTAGASQLNTDDLPVAEFFRKFGSSVLTKEEYPALLLPDIVLHKENAVRYAVNVPDSERAGLQEKMAAYFKGDSLRIEGHANYMRSFAIMKATTSKDYLNEAFQYYGNAYRNYLAAQAYLPDDRYLKEFFVEASRVITPN